MPQEYSNEKLVELIRSGIEPAAHMLQLWQQNRGLISKIAGRYNGYEDMEDLKQQGYIGMCDAVKGYCPEKGIPFVNYAANWIKQSMLRYIENNSSVVRIPHYKQQKQREYERFIREFETQTGRTPTDQEICYYMRMGDSDLQDIKTSMRMKQVRSLDSCISEDDDMTIGDLVPGDTDIENIVLSGIEKEELRNILWPLVNSLPEAHGEVIRLLYRHDESLRSTGELLHIPISRVRSIKEEALRKLRYSKRGRELRAFFPEAVESTAYRHNGLREFERTWTSSTELAVFKLLRKKQQGTYSASDTLVTDKP